MRRHLPWIILLAAGAAFPSHDDELGARFVQGEGVDASSCLDHDIPCESIQYALAQAQPGNTVKVAEGIYDRAGVEPESFLFGIRRAAGGYSEGDHFQIQDPEAHRTILVGVDVRYRQAMEKQGFKWAADRASALDLRRRHVPREFLVGQEGRSRVQQDGHALLHGGFEQLRAGDRRRRRGVRHRLRRRLRRCG